MMWTPLSSMGCACMMIIIMHSSPQACICKDSIVSVGYVCNVCTYCKYMYSGQEL